MQADENWLVEIRQLPGEGQPDCNLEENCPWRCRARNGARVLLVEQRSQLGGTVTGALIHTLAGLYDAAGEIMNDGLARELTERLLRADAATRCRKKPSAGIERLPKCLSPDNRTMDLCTQVR